MATELRAFTVTIPAGTPITAPVTIDVSFTPMVTERIEWRQPRGANGLMGWRITSGGAQVIPKNLGAFIVTDGEQATWQLDSLHDSGKWEVTGYNTGANPHILNVRFHVRPIPEGLAGPYPLSWLSASPPGRILAEIGAMAEAPAAVEVPRSVLWPPPGR